MKDLISYYNASKVNKVKIIVMAVFVYILLYFTANPYLFNTYLFKGKMFFRDTTSLIRNFDIKQMSETTPTPPIYFDNDGLTVPNNEVENVPGK